MLDKEKVVCKKCILHSQVPEVTIGNDGLCVFCQISRFMTPEMAGQNAIHLENRMLSIMENVRRKKRPYDVLVYFSGGKDSTYILNIMKNKYKLNVLAYSMIQPFVTELAQKNMEQIAKKFNVEAIKFFIEEDVFRKVMGLGLMQPEKYGLTEWAGCEICGFFTKWVGIKFAIALGIPLVVDGMDNAQGGSGVITEGSQVKQKIRNGKKPFAKIHDLFEDAMGEAYRNSIYCYNREELLDSDYPTHMSPLCFLEYDPGYSFSSLEKAGISFKKFKSLNTNCELLYLLDYISMIRYDCDSYIKLYASGLRNNYDTIEQLELDQTARRKQLTREEMIKLLDEYRQVLFYVMDNSLDESNISSQHITNMMRLTQFSRTMFGESTMNTLATRVVKMKGHAEYFGIDMKKLSAGLDNERTGT